MASDTTVDAHEFQLAVYRRMSPEQRLGVALQLGETSRRLLSDGVRLRHPDYDDEQVRLATIRLWLGEQQFRLAYVNYVEDEP